MVKEGVLGEGMGNLELKIVNSKSWLVGRVLVNHGFHGWARMDSEVGGAGDLRFEMGLV